MVKKIPGEETNEKEDERQRMVQYQTSHREMKRRRKEWKEEKVKPGIRDPKVEEMKNLDQNLDLYPDEEMEAIDLDLGQLQTQEGMCMTCV